MICGAQVVGILTFADAMFIAPEIVNALPDNCTPDMRLIAPLTISVPLKIELLAMLTAPSIFQKTFFACAPLINNTFEPTLVPKAPLTLMTNTALAFPRASKYSVSVKVTAASIKYVFGVKTKLCPNKSGRTNSTSPGLSPTM